MTVQEMLELPELTELKMVAGAGGADNEVSIVSVMDAPDIHNWMRGQEFLITTAYVFKDDVAGLATLIHKLANANVAAFGIKTNRFIGAVPQEALDAADRARLPLIHIPDRFPWTEIIQPVMQNVLDEYHQHIKRREEIHDLFTRLAVTGSRISDTLPHLEGFIKSPVVFWDMCFGALYHSSPEAPFSRRIAVDFENGKPLLPAPRGVRVHEVAIPGKTYGKVFYEKSPDVSAQVVKTALEYASLVMTIRMQTRLSNQAVEERYREQFLADLLFDNIKSDEEVQNRAALYGWDFAGGGVVVVVDINNYKRTYLKQFDAGKAEVHKQYSDHIFTTVIRHIAVRFHFALPYRQSDYVAVILSPTRQELRELRQRLEAAFQETTEALGEQVPFTSTMGVGGYCEAIRDIADSFQQARSTINLGYQSQRFNCVLFYEDMGIYRLLQSVKSTNAAQEYVEAYVMPLVRYGGQPGGELLETLQTLIDCGWKLKDAATRLHMHYNSAKYRFAKICDLLDMDLRQHQNQLNVEIALSLYKLNQTGFD